ncbi:DapH/DapD/GlmU-related protein [Arcobacter arenosus]|uniref:Acetyltransferase n=1 Tax=Arcobacter arenosus TaxID=2576037 RepID=A0A5R8Y121_9BACT|nr:DapH/DapD/GlmU-related protein [Arcobacter arenosus]TLP37783.1 hypothetical protein FDK22_10760 [Arcobacter arenosus]
MDNYAILGKGGLHDIIIDILGKELYQGFYDDRLHDTNYYLGELSNIGNFPSFLAIGSLSNMLLREKILKDLKNKNLLSLNAISPNVNFSSNTEIGFGNIILPFVQIGVNVRLGYGNVIFSNSTIEHDSKIGNNVNIAPGVNIAGSVTIEDNVYIGIGAKIIDGIKIGKNSVIGAGSIILENVEENSVYVGVPAKKIKNNNLYRSVY